MAKKKNKHLLSPLKWPFILLNILFAFILLLSYLAFYVKPSLIPFLAFFGLAYPYILLVNLLFIAFWFLVRIKYALISIVLIAIGWNHAGRLLQMNLSNKKEIETGGIVVVSYNVQNLIKMNTSTTRYITNFENKKKITSFLTGMNAGIICLQEFLYDREDLKKFPAAFGKKIGCQYVYYENYYSNKKDKIDAIATFSRYPILDKGYLAESDKVFGIYTDLIIGKDTVRVYNLHLASIHFRKEDYEFFGDMANQPEQKKLKTGSLQIFEKMKTAFIRRTIQMDQLEEQLKKSPYPVIICADLNDTPSSYTYNRLRQYGRDAFAQSGKGLGTTYAEKFFPAFRIDYIFHDQSFHSHHFRRHKIHFSDHYPISCTIVMGKAD